MVVAWATCGPQPIRSPADTHGQRRGGLDLHRFPFSQVTAAPDLALQAGGRRFESGGPTTSYGRLADGTTHKHAVLPIL
jgi:hypothetical protein